MSEFNGPSLNALPAALVSQTSEKSPQGGKSLPAQVVEHAETTREKLETAQLYEKESPEETEVAERSAATESMDDRIKEAVARLNDYVQQAERKLNFQVDEEAGLTIIRVFDKQSDELIRQIPSEDAVSLARKLNQEEPLMLFSAQV
ncbi:flagellar protein FlaG [Saccharospirillum sp. HFRX-1]|uniref:flagellar protein FlaG n=1 Tax=unclassified Saccharospirillum TaxID=2633430 RepID=UPI00372088F3